MEPIVHIRETIPVSLETLFKAWTEPKLMSRWLFKSSDNLIDVALQELVVGGRYSIIETTANNEKIDHYGVYLSIDPRAQLSFTLNAPKHFQGATTVTINLSDDAKGNCFMDFQQSGVDPKIVEDNWKTMFIQLRAMLSH